MYWFYLFIAIIFEVAATLSIKQVMVTNNSYWIISVVLCYLISFSLVGISVQKIDLGTAYAIWAGVGIALIVVLGYFIFRAIEVEKLQKLFIEEFKDYDNAIKITCSVAKYEKVEESFFELEI